MTGADPTQSQEVPSGLAQALLDHRQQIVRVLTARTGSSHEAEDVVQELWLRVGQGGIPPVGNALGYLMRAGLNIVVDRARERQRRERREADWVHEAVDGGAGEAIDEQPGADRVLAARERLREVATAISALPPGAGRVFRMHRIDGMSHAEIAAALGITRGAVEKHMAVALKHLARELTHDV